MTAKKTAGRKPRRLKVKRETLKDLSVKGRARKVKGEGINLGGAPSPTVDGLTCRCTRTCLYTCFC